MSEQKGFLVELAELVDHHMHRSPGKKPANESRPSRLSRILHWLTPNGGTLLLVALLIATTNVWAKPLLNTPGAPGPSATTVNYQGRLADSGGTPLNNNYGMTFALWDAPTEGNLVWGPESHAAVPVSDGLFSVGLGSQTSGGIPTSVWNGDRYLEISVGGETLSPRELIRSVPIAGLALTVPDGAVTSQSLNLSRGTACLSSQLVVDLPGLRQNVDVPGLSLDFSLARDSAVLLWIDGLVIFGGPDGHEFNTHLVIDGSIATTDLSYVHPSWFNVNGLRITDLPTGEHTLKVQLSAKDAGPATVHSNAGYKTCINYLVLGQ